MLYVKRDRIKDIWPLMAAPERMNDDIRKFEEIGTHSEAPYLATGEAITFHNTIGASAKKRGCVISKTIGPRSSWSFRACDFTHRSTRR